MEGGLFHLRNIAGSGLERGLNQIQTLLQN